MPGERRTTFTVIEVRLNRIEEQLASREKRLRVNTWILNAAALMVIAAVVWLYFR